MSSPARPTRASLHAPAALLVLGWFVAAAVVAVAHRFLPDAGWLMVHLLLTGGVSTAVLLWSQHFAETLLRRPTPGGRAGLWARLLVWSLGTVVVACGMAADVAALTVVGAVLLVLTVAGHVTVLVLQGRGRSRLLVNRYAHLVRYYLAACAFLPVGVALGVALAHVDAGPAVAGRLYLAHVTATVLGWIGITVAGTVVLLWPTILHTRIGDDADRAARQALWTLTAGVVVMLLAPATGVQWVVLPGAAAVVAAIGLLARHVWLQGRAHPPRTVASWSVAASLVWFAAAVVGLGVLVVAAPSWAAVPARLTVLVAPVAVGFVGQVMVGAMSYLLPVVLGGGPAAARWSATVLDRWGVQRVVVLNLCLVLFALSSAPSTVRVTVSMLGLVPLLVFLGLGLRVVLVQRRPARRTAPAEEAGAPDGSARTVAAVRVAAAGVGVGLVALAVLGGVVADPVAAGVTTLPAAVARATSAEAAATGRTTTVTVTMQDMRFSPDVVEVPAGDRLVVRVVNADDQVHDLVLASGATSGRVPAGQEATLDAGVVTTDLDGWCSVAGHRVMGMTLRVVATGGAVGTVAADGAGGTHDGDGMEGMAGMDGTDAASAADDLDLMASFPAGFRAPDATLAPAATSGTDASGATAEPDPDGQGTLHRVTMHAQRTEVEVAPGVRQERWTFGGTAPGPTLRGQVGDTFVVTLVNDDDMGHSIDFHAGSLAPDEPMRTLDPGERLTYTFRADRSGVWMYHCSTMPMSLHIANGMTGAVVIDPPGMPPVDHEYLLVQSELYLGAQGGSADAARVATQDPDLVTFNGVANAYAADPLRVRTGDRVRFWVLDAGPNRPSSFHVVGGQFDTVFAEGDWTLRDGGSTGTGGSQALALQAAQGGFVELTFPEAGHYPFVSHVMSDAEKGARGVVEVTD